MRLGFVFAMGVGVVVSRAAAGQSPTAAGQSRAAAYAACGPAATRSGTLERSRSFEEAAALPPQPARVLGQVVDVVERPIPNAVVLLFRQMADSQPARGAGADSLGRFVLDSVPPGRYVARVRAVAYQQQWHELVVIRGGADTVCFHLRAAPVMPKEFPVGLVR